MTDGPPLLRRWAVTTTYYVYFLSPLLFLFSFQFFLLSLNNERFFQEINHQLLQLHSIISKFIINNII